VHDEQAEEEVQHLPDWFQQPTRLPSPDHAWNKSVPVPLPLVPNSQGRHVIPFPHFINNDLEYLRGGESSRKYSTSIMKTKAADYRHLKWIEDLVPNSMSAIRLLYKVEDIVTCLVEYVKFWDDWEVDRYGNANLALAVEMCILAKLMIECWNGTSGERL
ncbi:hypothetical protein Tco_0644138, partial [Tanacetum coccineum]